MKVGYFECVGGISGDMILGALVDAGADLDTLKSELKKLSVSGYEIKKQTVEKGGHRACKITVRITSSAKGRSFDDIKKIIQESALSESVKTQSLAVFGELARAEALAHGTAIEEVHFHEVGATDALVDIVGSVLCLSMLGVDKVRYSPLPVANLAPAAVEIIKGMTVRGVDSAIETVTPTGASLVKTLADPSFIFPVMNVESIGCGAGEADTRTPNIVRFYIGDSSRVFLVETNLDDVTAETIGHATEALFEHGALDVWSTAIYMKKNRPGVTLSFLCRDDDLKALCERVFKETGTLGLRVSEPERIALSRNEVEVDTEFGSIPIKIGHLADQTVSARPEYEVCKSKARSSGVPLETVTRAAMAAYERLSGQGIKPT